MVVLNFDANLGIRRNLKAHFRQKPNYLLPKKNTPWSEIQNDNHNYNYLVTVNPDPRFHLEYNDKKFMLKHFTQFLIDNSSLLREYTCVMEEGKGKLHFHLIISATCINVATLKRNILRTYSTRSAFHHRTCLITKIKDFKDKITAQTQFIGEKEEILPNPKKYKSGYPYLIKENINEAQLYKKPIKI